MNNLMKRNGNGHVPATPFGGMVDSLFPTHLDRLLNDEFWGFNGVTQHAHVPVNIRETDKSFELDMAAPGQKKEDFKINVTGNVLKISFEHQEENGEENREQKWLRKEFHKRSFQRFFTMDDAIDPGKISATYTDGVLHVSLPKKESAQTLSRTIEIN